MADLQGRAERAAGRAVEAARSTLETGRFRAVANPTVLTRQAEAGDPVSAWLAWRSDEEATGWPQMELGLLIDAQPAGPRLAMLSTREPGYDLSRLRIDKQQRDHLLRTAGSGVAEAIRDELFDPADLAWSSGSSRLASADTVVP